MPESKGRARKFTRRDGGATVQTKLPGASPRWWAPVMVTLMVVGLMWIVAFYLTGGVYPVPAWGYWNLAAGFGLIMAGFFMTTGWR